MLAIRGHFDGKVIVPDEPVDFPDGQELIVHLEPVTEPVQQNANAFFGSADQYMVDDPSLPTDLGKQLDHYLYGSPKREE